MAFDPHRDVSVASGAFRVDVNELCAAHTLLSHQRALFIAPARFALGTALTQAEAASTLAPTGSARLVRAIIAAMGALEHLASGIDSLMWKLQDTALTYGDAEASASLWEVVPGSPMGPPVGPGGLAPWVLAPGIAGLSGTAALFHAVQDASSRAGVPPLASALLPGDAHFVAAWDLWRVAQDGAAFAFHTDHASGARFQRDLGRFAFDVDSLPENPGITPFLAGRGVSRGPSPTSTRAASGVAAVAVASAVALGFRHGRSYGVAVRGADGRAHVRPGGAAGSLPPGVFAARTRATLEAMPQAAPDTHYTGVATSADTIEHITTMSGGDADNGEIAIEEHVTAHQDGTTTRSWTVDIRGTQSFMVGESGPQDSLSNLQGVAAMPSDQLDAVKEAMRAAGIGPGEAVEFAGHSQGGIMAAQLAADPQVRADYNVVSVLTAGSPTATVAPSDVPVLAYENFGDIVPGCDGEATRGDNVTTVMFRDYAAATHTEDPVPSSHSAPLYVDEIRTTLNAAKASSDPGLSALAAAEARRTQALGLTDNTHTTIHHYQTRRITQK